MLKLHIGNILDRKDEMMIEKTVTLSSITKDGKGTYGIGAKAVPYSDKLYTYLRITDIKDDGTLDLQNLKSVDDEKAKQYLLRPNDIVFARTGASTGRNYFYDGTDGEFVYAGFLIKYSIDEKKVNPKYVKYYCQSKQYKNWINSFNSGSTRGNINAKTFNQMPIPLIDRKMQDVLVSILSSIDAKINKNKEINNNLEQQADALYQTFFSPKSGTQGKIVTLDEYCSIFTGKKNANASVNGGKYKFFTCAPEALQIDSYIFDGNAIIVSGNGAYTGRTRFYSGKFDLYQRTYACTLLDNVNPDFIFPLYWFVKLELSKKIMGGTRGSAIPYIVMNDLAKFEFIYNEEMFANYTPLFKSLTEAIQANEFESENLAQIRDSLLPKLMSGELDVSDTKL